MGRDSVSLREHEYGVRIAVLEERWKGAARREKDYRKNIEKRLSDLNGEAGRLKTILEASVPLETFNRYVDTEREKATARADSDRARFEAYVNAQATAFKVYADEVAKWRASINVRLAGWIGGATVALAILELVLNKKL
jgi:hypothetical protein